MDERRKTQLGITTQTSKDPVLNRAGFTRAQLQTALDLNIPLDTVARVMDTWEANVLEFIRFDKMVRQEALRNLTQESQNTEGGYR